MLPSGARAVGLQFDVMRGHQSQSLWMVVETSVVRNDQARPGSDLLRLLGLFLLCRGFLSAILGKHLAILPVGMRPGWPSGIGADLAHDLADFLMRQADLLGAAIVAVRTGRPRQGDISRERDDLALAQAEIGPAPDFPEQIADGQ